MACPRCAWPYPTDLLVPMFIGGSGYTAPVCGVCALDLTNAVHGTRLVAFQGEIAEDMRQQALAWRRRHPHADPARKKKKQP